MKIKIYSTMLAVCLLLSISVLFSSCYMDTSAGVTNAEINENGELVLSYADGSEQNLGVVVGANGADGKDSSNGAISSGTVVINSEKSNISAATAKGLANAVSITCNFKTTVQAGGGWRPGSSNTSQKEYSSSGSGVIYKLDKAAGDAFIITNYHVVYDASSNSKNGISEDIKVYIYGSELEENAIEATYVGGSLYYDIAVLRVEDSEILKNSSVMAVEISNSDNVAVGDNAIAIGNAQGYGIAASFGIVSVDSEYITMTSADGKTSVSFRVMRIDTAVNSGNSGGGLYDDKGNLIGIVNAKIVEDGVENIGYAIPSTVVVSIAENIIDYCYEKDTQRVQRALLGIKVSTSNSKAVYDSQTGRFEIKETVSVSEVNANSLSEGILEVGDVLLSVTINDKTTSITRQHHAIDIMLDVRVGDIVTFNILRDGEEKSVSITITEKCLTEY